MLKLDQVAPGLPVDAVYAELVALGHGRTGKEAHEAMAALVLVLANQVADPSVVLDAIALVDAATPRAGAGGAAAGRRDGQGR